MNIEIEIYTELSFNEDNELELKMNLFLGETDTPSYVESISVADLFKLEWKNYTVPSNPRKHNNTGKAALLLLHKVLKKEVKNFKKLIKETDNYEPF